MSYQDSEVDLPGSFLTFDLHGEVALIGQLSNSLEQIDLWKRARQIHVEVLLERLCLSRHPLYCSQAWSWVIQKSMSLEYEPASQLLHISVQ